MGRVKDKQPQREHFVQGTPIKVRRIRYIPVKGGSRLAWQSEDGVIWDSDQVEVR